jgi:hypothetical protein
MEALLLLKTRETTNKSSEEGVNKIKPVPDIRTAFIEIGIYIHNTEQTSVE